MRIKIKSLLTKLYLVCNYALSCSLWKHAEHNASVAACERKQKKNNKKY